MRPSMPRTAAALAALALLAGCGSELTPDPGPPGPSETLTISLPSSAAKGDEIVATLAATRVAGDWHDERAPGALVELQLGGNLARHVVFVGGWPSTQRVSLGAWDGGELTAQTVTGDLDVTISAEVDPSAAGVPIMGLLDERWWNDVALLSYAKDGKYTFVFTNEDGGTGLWPTLLMAQYGRPSDIEGLYEAGEPAIIQGDGHVWQDFEGPYEGKHPWLRVTTKNGMVGPGDGKAWDDSDPVPIRLSPMPVDFNSDDAAGIPREAVLDTNPWVLAAGFAEFERQHLVIEDGGPADKFAGGAWDYLYLDYRFDGGGGVEVAFEAEVDGQWWSSLNGWLMSGGLTNAHAYGTGRTCIELPTGKSAKDVTGLRAVVTGGDGTLVKLRWFGYDEGLRPIELGALAAPKQAAAGETITLE